MAHAHLEMKDRRTSQESQRDLSVTPTAGIAPDHVSCEIKMSSAIVTVEFSRSEVMEMLGTFPDYIPTMDAALRFMRSNPETSVDMMAEISPYCPFCKKSHVGGDTCMGHHP